MPRIVDDCTVSWSDRDAKISNPSTGDILFEQKGVQFPTTWSDNAVNIVASKYFYGNIDGEGTREQSLSQLVRRVVDTIADAGFSQGVLTEEEAVVFGESLDYLLFNQIVSFNSPVWFNVGLGQQYGLRERDRSSHVHAWMAASQGKGVVSLADPYWRPQASACFIISVGDTITDIMNCMSDSARLFKYGSGVGADWSSLRSKKDVLSGGGSPSGPVSFMEVQDAVGGTIKSGGKTRRAAIMQTLKSHHPDIMEFVAAKQTEERKAHALIDAGYDGSFNGPAYASVAFQNVNQSVRLDDTFMHASQSDNAEGAAYPLFSPSSGKRLDWADGREVLQKIAEGTWLCGDPGVQYEDEIQKWHTCPNSGPINSSNPCSEYLFLDDSACNLASINLKKFIAEDGTYQWKELAQAARIFATAMDILVDLAGYPSDAIAKNSHNFRPLGLGFSNLGASLMAQGMSYDSDAGRSFAGCSMATINGAAYEQSARIASRVGPFAGYADNREPFIGVMKMHEEAALDARAAHPEHDGWDHAAFLNTRMVEFVEKVGARNSQATVLAPTGTISFMMDCDTTGIEPELALVKYKLLAGKGDGMMKIVNQTVEEGLAAIGMKAKHRMEVLKYIHENGYADGAPHLTEEQQAIFDTSFQPEGCSRVLGWKAHIDMMAACQPFVSGAISKTVNLPETASVEDIKAAYVRGWKKHLKAVAVYRSNSKRSQPLSTSKGGNTTQAETLTSYSFYDANDDLVEVRVHADDALTLSGAFLRHTKAILNLESKLDASQEAGIEAKNQPSRRRLPNARPAIAQKFSVSGHEGYLHIGLYPDTLMPGEIFIRMSKEGSTMSGMLDAFATSISMAIQHGVPLENLVNKFSHVRFEPSGFTGDPDLPSVTSVLDYIFRFLGQTFIDKTREHILAKCYGAGFGHQIRLEEPEDALALREAFNGMMDNPNPTSASPLVMGDNWLTTSVPRAGVDNGLVKALPKPSSSGPPCANCGALTVPSGSCYSCPSCGNTSGCG